MTDIDVNSLEPNSHKYKAEKAKNAADNQNKRKRIDPVIDRSRIVSTKKPLSKRFLEMFVSEDSDDVKTWLIMDVIVPGIKNTILDIIAMMFFGERFSSNKRGYRRDRDDRVDYSSRYRESSYGRRDSRRRRDRDDDYYDTDDRVDFRNIVLRNRSDAEQVIDAMRKRIHEMGSASVADLLDLIDVPGRYTDNNYGWDDERDIGIRRVSSGFLVDVAEPKYLD